MFGVNLAASTIFWVSAFWVSARDSCLFSEEQGRSIELPHPYALQNVSAARLRPAGWRTDASRCIGPVSVVRQILEELGTDAETIIAAAGIDVRPPRNPESTMTLAAIDRLLGRCVVATGCAHFGLLVGQRASVTSLGLVGRLMRHAPTFGDALADLCLDRPRSMGGATAYLIVQDGIVFWGHAVHAPGLDAIEQVGDGALAMGFNLMRELIGEAPEEILIARSVPVDMAPYRRCFGATPRFDCEQNALAFSRALLARPVRGADPAERRRLERLVSDYRVADRPSVVDQVTRCLRVRVGFADATLGFVARELRMEPRTLNRRLQAEGTNFRDLANQVRFEVACQLLKGTRMKIADVALALGYAEASCLDHAFKRWSGTPPRTWRLQL